MVGKEDNEGDGDKGRKVHVLQYDNTLRGYLQYIVSFDNKLETNVHATRTSTRCVFDQCNFVVRLLCPMGDSVLQYTDL